jgi:hypothetical protein
LSRTAAFPLSSFVLSRHAARMMFRWLLLLGLVLLGGCAKPELADTPVRAGTAEELTAFRAELGQRFPAEALATFDTAINELQLAGMDRGLETASARAAAMREQVNGRTVRAVQQLGFAARRARFLGEIKLMTELQARDLAIRERTAAAGNTPRAVLDRIASADEVLTKLRRQLAETEQQLAAWDTSTAAPR